MAEPRSAGAQTSFQILLAGSETPSCKMLTSERVSELTFASGYMSYGRGSIGKRENNNPPPRRLWMSNMTKRPILQPPVGESPPSEANVSVETLCCPTTFGTSGAASWGPQRRANMSYGLGSIVKRDIFHENNKSPRSQINIYLSSKKRRTSASVFRLFRRLRCLQRSEAPPCWLLFVLQLLPAFLLAASPASVCLFSLPGCGLEPSQALEVFWLFLLCHCVRMKVFSCYPVSLPSSEWRVFLATVNLMRVHAGYKGP
ncbi:unnamed protein product [Arctogadus glacialis]